MKKSTEKILSYSAVVVMLLLGLGTLGLVWPFFYSHRKELLVGIAVSVLLVYLGFNLTHMSVQLLKQLNEDYCQHESSGKEITNNK